MASWVVCPGCSLRHSARPDGVCPRCKKSLASDATEASPASTVPPNRGALPDVYDGSLPPTLLRAEEAPASEKTAFGARLAGGIMVLNGVALLAESSLGLGASATSDSVAASPPTRLLFSFVLGGLVLYGSAGAVKTARALVCLSAVVLPLILLSQSEPVVAVLQLAFSVSLLLLLFGDAGRLRIGVALALAAAFFSVEGVGLYAIASGHHPLGRLMMARELEPGPVAKVEGAQVRYHLSAPAGSWYLRTEAAAHKDNALADRWLVRPDRDAHVMVIAETLPAGSVATMERFRETVLANMKKAGKDFTILEEGPIITSLEAGLMVHAKGEVKGQRFEWLIGLYIQHPYIFQVMAFSSGRSFPDVEPEVRRIVTSLEL